MAHYEEFVEGFSDSSDEAGGEVEEDASGLSAADETGWPKPGGGQAEEAETYLLGRPQNEEPQTSLSRQRAADEPETRLEHRAETDDVEGLGSNKGGSYGAETLAKGSEEEAVREVLEPQPEAEEGRATYHYVVGGSGLPLDRLRDEMAVNRATRVEGEEVAGSGALVYCELDRDYRAEVSSEPEGSTYYIEVREVGDAPEDDEEEPEGSFRMAAEANVPEGVASFSFYTEAEDGTRAADLYAREFARWALDTFREWGADIREVASLWLPESVNYNQFRDALDHGATPQEAANSTWSAELYRRLGFNNTKEVTVTVPQGEDAEEAIDVVRVRFSKTSDEEVTRLDTQVVQEDEPRDAAQELETTGREWREGVPEYLEKVRGSELEKTDKVEVPVIGGPMPYVKADQGWLTNADHHQYNAAVFSEEFEPDFGAVPLPGRRLPAVRRSEATVLVAGGLEEALAAGRRVLDVGSGKAVALLEYSALFPETVFVGVDSGYGQVREIDLDRVGVQLTRGNWNDLAGIPDGSMDTIITRGGPFLWAEGEEFIRAIHRVAAEEAVLRFSAADALGKDLYDVRANRVLGMLRRLGWEVVQPSGPDGSVVAIRRAA